MEDYRIDIMIDKGPSARSIQIDLNPFTAPGAGERQQGIRRRRPGLPHDLRGSGRRGKPSGRVARVPGHKE